MRPAPVHALPLLLVCHGAAPAGQAPDPAADSWTFTFLFENDLFGDTDEQYTNGIQVSAISPDLHTFRDRLPERAAQWVDRLHVFDSPESGRRRNVALLAGQKIFTPQDIARADLVTDDRPYAGWLYAGAAFHSKDDRVLDTMEVQIGLIGPAALGEEAQDLVHDIRGLAKARGWNHQIDTEPGIALIYERKWRAWRERLVAQVEFDLVTHMGAVLGNVFVYGNAGAEARLGWRLPTDFGTSLIRPGGESNAPTSAHDARFAPRSGFSFHGYAALTGRLVGRDIFLDGSTFADSHSVDRKIAVADLLAGVALTWDRWKIAYAQVFRTREFDGQQGGVHEFGSVSLSYTF
jgi:hypothetical protein